MIERVTDKIGGAIRRQLQVALATMRTRAVWHAAGIIVAGALAIGGACYYWGRTDGVASVQTIATGLENAFKAGPDIGAAWLRLMRANNPVAALAACKVVPASKETGMRRGCWMPMWLDPPAMSPPQ